MTPAELETSAENDPAPPPSLTPTQKILWLAKAGKWDAAHDACQNLPEPDASWIHAHLHRQEGDLPNASYWYRRAGKPTPPQSVSLAEEWNNLAKALA